MDRRSSGMALLVVVAAIGCASQGGGTPDARTRQGVGTNAVAGQGVGAAGQASKAASGTGGSSAQQGAADAAMGASTGQTAGTGGGGAGGAVVDGGTGVQVSTVIPCTSAEWTQNCGSTCRFDAASLDCTTACMNLSRVCATGCPTCQNVNLDQATCLAGCATYRSVTCFNRLLGCFMTNTTCESETVCANANH